MGFAVKTVSVTEFQMNHQDTKTTKKSQRGSNAGVQSHPYEKNRKDAKNAKRVSPV